MTLFLIIVFDVVMTFVFLPACIYVFCRVFVPVMAEKETFFSSPKLGRIKVRRRGGKVVCYFDNIIGKNKHVNRETGKIEDGEIIPTDWCWRHFGAHFIGLDEIYQYVIATEALEDNNGDIKYVEMNASSIFLEGSYPITFEFVSRDGVRLKVKLHLKLTTVDAAKALSLPVSWTRPVFSSVIAASRDFFGSRNVKSIISTPNEGHGNFNGESEQRNSDYMRQILSLNNPIEGNISLDQLCGQKIDAINIIDIDFADQETKKAYYIPFMAEQQAQKQVKEAEAYASAIVIRSKADSLAAANIASSITQKGNAEAEVYNKKHKGIGEDSKSTAQVITAEKQSEMQNLRTLITGGGGSMVSIPINTKD